MQNHDAVSEARLNRQILNNSVKRKAMEDLCERPRKLVHKELRSQYLDTVTYKDVKNISRNIHKAHSSQLLPLPKDTEETHEELNVSKFDRTCLLTFRHRASSILGQAFHYLIFT